MQSHTRTTLYYVHDPMCSWCWGFRPAWEQLRKALPETIELVTRVGGLAPDSGEPMAMGIRETLQATWQRIQQVIPGTEFNFEFWRVNTPRRSTYPACRAAIAARELADKESEMTLAIQRAYYLQARNPSDLEVLCDAADSIGMDRESFKQRMQSEAINDSLQQELMQVRAIGVNSFPSLVLELGESLINIPVRYTEPDAMLANINQLIAQQQAME